MAVQELPGGSAKKCGSLSMLDERSSLEDDEEIGGFLRKLYAVSLVKIKR